MSCEHRPIPAGAESTIHRALACAFTSPAKLLSSAVS
jgi:hypothetical protein